MTEKIQDSHEADPSDPQPATWADMREAGLMIEDATYDKLAVYVGGDGHLVIMSQGVAEDEPHYHTVHCTQVKPLIAALEKWLPEAEEENRIFEEKCEQAQREFEALEAAGAGGVEG